MGSDLTPEQKRFLASQIMFQDEDKLEEGIFTLVFTEYTPERIKELHKYDYERYQIRAAGRKLDAWTGCPSCGRQVMEKQLIKKGCYLCGWQRTRGQVESAGFEGPGNITETSTGDETEQLEPYRIDCPECRTRVVREHLIEKGCYICGFKLARRRPWTDEER